MLPFMAERLRKNNYRSESTIFRFPHRGECEGPEIDLDILFIKTLSISVFYNSGYNYDVLLILDVFVQIATVCSCGVHIHKLSIC